MRTRQAHTNLITSRVTKPRRPGSAMRMILFIVCILAKAGQATPQDDSGELLVTIFEGQSDLLPKGTSIHDCMLVRSDGHFHLESRVQRLPKPAATLKVVDSLLDTAQLVQLKDILGDQTISKLPAYRQPAIPMSVTWSRGFNAQIVRGSKVQSVGYWSWKGGSPNTSPNSSPENVKAAWRDSERALKPLVEWFHNVEALSAESPNSTATMCGASSSMMD
jgi:hypothetical protein